MLCPRQFLCGSRVVKYDGQRETEDIVKFVKANSYREVNSLDSIGEIKAHRESLETFGVAVFKDLESSAAKVRASECPRSGA